MRKLDLLFVGLLLVVLSTLGWWWSQRYAAEAEALEVRLENRISEWETKVLVTTLQQVMTLRTDSVSGWPQSPIQFTNAKGEKPFEVTGLRVSGSTEEEKGKERDTTIHIRLETTQEVADPPRFSGLRKSGDSTLNLFVMPTARQKREQWDSLFRTAEREFAVKLRLVPEADAKLSVGDTLGQWRLPLSEGNLTFGIGKKKIQLSPSQFVVIDDYRTTLIGNMRAEIGMGLVLLLGLGLFYVFVKRDIRRREASLVEKDRFIANVAHELKTPIATVGVALEALDHFGADADPQRRKQYLSMSREELKRLESLAERALGTLQLESQTTRDKLHPVAIGAIALESWNALAVKHQLPEDTVRWQSVDGAGRVTKLDAEDLRELRIPAQADLLRHLFDNLLDNAIKYGGDPPKLTITFGSPEGKMQLFSVRDNGGGIAPTERKRVFEKFYRIQRPGEGHTIKGHGLGLAYVREIVRTHGGEIFAEPAPDGNGTSFVVKLPR